MAKSRVDALLLHGLLPSVPAAPIPEPWPIIVPETNGRPVAKEGCHR
jgi:hypothetical protein